MAKVEVLSLASRMALIELKYVSSDPRPLVIVGGRHLCVHIQPGYAFFP